MKLFSFYSLRIRLIVVFLLAVVPALGLTWYTASEERRRETAEAEDSAMHLASIIAIQEDQLLATTRQLLVALSYHYQETVDDPAACSALFSQMIKQHFERYANIGVAKPNGDVFCSAVPLNRPVNIADREYFKNAVKTRDFSVAIIRWAVSPASL